MMRIFLIFINILVLSINLYSFDLCPACSPEVITEKEKTPGYMLGKNRFSLISLYRLWEHESGASSGHSSEMERALFAFNYGLLDRLKAGFMYGITSKKLSLQIDCLLLREKNIIPALILGTGSFRSIFSESHPYLIAMKNVGQYIKLPLRVAIGIKHRGEDFSKVQLEPVGNLILLLHHPVYIMGIFEGEAFDLAIYSLLLINLFSVSV